MSIRGIFSTISRSRIIPAVVLVAVVAVFGGWYIWHNNQPPQGWVKFESQKYGLKFIYPKSWGNPIISEYAADTGKRYLISFANPNEKVQVDPKTLMLIQPKTSTGITMDSDDATFKLCPIENQCQNLPMVTKSYITSQLNKASAVFVQQDETSYSQISVSPAHNQQSGLDVYQIANLPKIKVTAAHGSFYISGNKPDCPKNSFSNKEGCVSQDDFVSFAKVLKSLKAL